MSLRDERTSSLVPTSLFELYGTSINDFFYSCLIEVGTYSVVGPVRLCVCVCLSVHLHYISPRKTCRGIILGSMVGYEPQMGTIDFRVSWCIFKVAVSRKVLSIWLMQRSKILMVFNDSCDTIIRCFKIICGVFY